MRKDCIWNGVQGHAAHVFHSFLRLSWSWPSALNPAHERMLNFYINPTVCCPNIEKNASQALIVLGPTVLRRDVLRHASIQARRLGASPPPGHPHALVSGSCNADNCLRASEEPHPVG